LFKWRGMPACPRGDNSKRVKIHRKFLKSSPEPAGQFQSNLV
jgi:hypothetical protein